MKVILNNNFFSFLFLVSIQVEVLGRNAMDHDPKPWFNYFGVVSQLVQLFHIVSRGLGGLSISKSDDVASFDGINPGNLDFFGGLCIQ
jgi:hypothetical protein